MGNKLKYSSNEFLSQTTDSNDKAVKLITYHLSMLKVLHVANPLDADYTMMYDRTLIVSNDAETKFYNEESVMAGQTGQTKAVKIELTGIKGSAGKARDWYNRTSAIYLISDPARLQAIYSRGLKPFRGKIDNIIGALNTLSLNIGADTNPLMIAIKGEVDASYAIINPDRATQKEDFGTTKFSQGAVRTACQAAMTVEYQNSGIMLNKFPNNDAGIQESVHDMELLIGKQQSVWNLSPTPGEVIDVAKRAQLANSKFAAKTIGGAGKLYLATTPGGIDSTAVNLVDGIQNNFLASAFGITDYVAHRYITFVSMAGVVISFKLKLG
jgi:hypothetical protein